MRAFAGGCVRQTRRDWKEGFPSYVLLASKQFFTLLSHPQTEELPLEPHSIHSLGPSFLARDAGNETWNDQEESNLPYGVIESPKKTTTQNSLWCH